MKPLLNILLVIPLLILSISAHGDTRMPEEIVRPLSECVERAERAPREVAIWDLEIAQQPVTGPMVLNILNTATPYDADVRALSVFKKNRPARDAMPPEAARLERIKWRNFFLDGAELTIRIIPKKIDGFYRTWELIGEIEAADGQKVSCGPPVSFCEDGSGLAPSCAILKDANCAMEQQCLDLILKPNDPSLEELSIEFVAVCKQDECFEREVELYCGLRLPNFSIQGQPQDIFIALFPSTVALAGLGKTPRANVRVRERETSFPSPQLGWVDDLRIATADAEGGTIQCWLIEKGQRTDSYWPMLFDYNEILNDANVDPVSLRNTIARIFGRNQSRQTLLMPSDYAERVITAQSQEWVDRLIGSQQVQLDSSLN